MKTWLALGALTLSVPAFPAPANSTTGYDLSYPGFHLKAVTSDGAPVENATVDVYVTGMQYGPHPDCDDNGIHDIAGVCNKWETISAHLYPTDANGEAEIPGDHLTSSDDNWSQVFGELLPVFGISVPGCADNYLLDTETFTCDSPALVQLSGAGLAFVLKDRSDNSQIPAQVKCTLPMTQAALAQQVANAKKQCPTN